MNEQAVDLLLRGMSDLFRRPVNTIPQGFQSWQLVQRAAAGFQVVDASLNQNERSFSPVSIGTEDGSLL
mgnify:CR=1 FL=1